MKILGIFLMILFCSVSLVILLDLSMNFSLSQSLSHLINPFRVMDAGEYVMLTGLFLIVISHQIIMIIKSKSNRSN
ncbi:hypothetical protein [Niallia sp. NCCP-28]|uniref:hypothetical protein n=1 Tax=Niallia sp. NCCP-28 TaxID=2934712 RepID=UPI00208CA184|nr:hypothetical protein [Niallia sp. NCCP-28]GKU83521.1 hypothetical protein NCCP28_29170 [Niallia sp. NCCP-28]